MECGVSAPFLATTYNFLQSLYIPVGADESLRRSVWVGTSGEEQNSTWVRILQVPRHVNLFDGPSVPHDLMSTSREPCSFTKVPEYPQIWTSKILWIQEKGSRYMSGTKKCELCAKTVISESMCWSHFDVFAGGESLTLWRWRRRTPGRVAVNLQTPNVNYSWRTAPLNFKVAFYIFIQQI